jgi:hypothetical protein
MARHPLSRLEALALLETLNAEILASRGTTLTLEKWCAEGWETKPLPAPAPDAAGSLPMPDALFEHRAALYTEDGKPFSEVDEAYRRAPLDFPPPAP